MRYVITGATGMIGCALLNEIVKNGEEAVAIVNPESKRLDHIPENIKVVFCSLSDYKNFYPDFSADVFIHLAWAKTDYRSRDDKQTQESNVSYTLDAVDLAKRLGCKAFVGAGSQAEYGLKNEPLKGDMEAKPESEYGKAKLKACNLSRSLCASYKIKFNWCRILSVYGPMDNKTTLISYLIESFLKNQSPVLTKCEQMWDYLYSEDCARALYLTAKKGKDGKIYPIGSGKARQLKEYVLDIAEEIGYNGKVEFGGKDYYPHQPMFLCADIRELEKDVGFAPSVSFKEGIRNIIQKEEY